MKVKTPSYGLLLFPLALFGSGCDEVVKTLRIDAKVLRADGKPVKAQSAVMHLKWQEQTNFNGGQLIYPEADATFQLGGNGEGTATGFPTGYKTPAEGFEFISAFITVEEGRAYLTDVDLSGSYDDETESYEGWGTFKVVEEDAEEIPPADDGSNQAAIRKLNEKVRMAVLKNQIKKLFGPSGKKAPSDASIADIQGGKAPTPTLSGEARPGPWRAGSAS